MSPTDPGADAPAAPAPLARPDAVPQAPPSAPEAPPMFDVHPLPKAARGWKEFLIHIATISVGLLIALGLEQLVAYVDHRHELSVARRELATEIVDNEAMLRHNVEWTQKLGAQLDANLALLRAPQPPNGRALRFPVEPGWPLDGTWQAVKQSGSIALMPHAELDRYVYLHEGIQAVMDASIRLAARLEAAAAIAQRSPDGTLTARDVEELVTATSVAQGELAFLVKCLHYEELGLSSARR